MPQKKISSGSQRLSPSPILDEVISAAQAAHREARLVKTPQKSEMTKESQFVAMSDLSHDDAFFDEAHPL
jgi:hypothetical protein